jgi:dipeptidyl aminopeptidase/acylaminoacyl peptidase
MTETEQETLEETAISATEEVATDAAEEAVNVVVPEVEAVKPVIAPVQPGPLNPSPDASQIAYFLPDEAGATTLWVRSLDGGDVRKISTPFTLVVDSGGPQWSPDGTQLAVTGLEGESGTTALWVISVESGEASRPLVRSVDEHTPRWSPDGSLLAFISHRNGRNTLHVAAPDGSMPAMPLTDAPLGHDEKEPVWSKDGARIAFCRWSPEVGEAAGGDQIWIVEIATGEIKQLTKKLARRRGLVWGPERPLIAHITDDGEWDNVAVVNADNAAAWTISSEPGDKDDVHWSADGNRVLYTRLLNGVIRVCDKATSAATANLLDPGDGVVGSPRWLPSIDGPQPEPEPEPEGSAAGTTGDESTTEEKPEVKAAPPVPRVVYAYAGVGEPFRFIVQENKTDAAERAELPVGEWSTDTTLIKPSWSDFKTTTGAKLSGSFYFPRELSGWAPGVLFLGDHPERPRDNRFRATEQVLARNGFAVFAPSLPGTPGLGRKVTNLLKEQVDSESEIYDLIDALDALRNMPSVDGDRIAVVGQGYGGTLALLLAGGRPGTVKAAVAIDPITDWDLELDEADDEWRSWILKNYGLPSANAGRYALRTPATFAGVIDAPLLMIDTDRTPIHRTIQREVLAGTIREIGVDVREQVVTGETEWETAGRAAKFVRDAIKSIAPKAGPTPADEALSPDVI